MRISTALVGVIGLVAGTVAVASPSAVSMEPMESGGSVSLVGVDSTVPAGTEAEGYTAISQRTDNNVFAVRASDGTLERIKSDANVALDIPSGPGGVAGKRILSLGASGSAGGEIVGVVTDDGLPHVWGSTASAADLAGVVNGLTSAELLGGSGAPAKAARMAANGEIIGILLDDGRVGVATYAIIDEVGAYIYRVLDLPEQVEQVDIFSEKPGLVLRLANGGVLIWNHDSTSQGTVTVPAFPEMAGRPSGPADPLVDVQASKQVAVGVTAAGKVYAMKSDGTRIDDTMLPPNLPTPGATVEGNPVEAALIAVSGATVYLYVVRTDADKLYVYGRSSGSVAAKVAAYREQVDGLDLSGKTISSVTGGIANLQVILADVVVPPMEVVSAATIASSTGDLGNPKVGDTLTGTPATFNATEGVVLTNQWLANGIEIDGATELTLALSSAEVGKQITFRTTAVRGEESVSGTSSEVGPVAEPAVVIPPVPNPADTPACQAAQAAAGSAQVALTEATAKVKKAKTKLKKAKKAHKPAKKIKKLKKKLKKAKKAQKAASSASATASANVTAKCS
ncbi:hypothetical protein KVF89_04470 [Nocardioides carbamazepini]|uniref:hypothetical protein n=1 Tax=Nocardioides carbamazepini TaxID=2854259 RepID=UPI002149DFB7|nr:hypothetical protein [Nocardioides carbamazepini]MCR1781782.1 hypothetical protein [Nocardioides carbamazepini]